MTGNVQIQADEWTQHAAWYDAEGLRIREHLAVDPQQLANAKAGFGKIGWEPAQAFAELMAQRAAAGQALGAYCDGVAAHIRTSVQNYTDTEAENQRQLST